MPVREPVCRNAQEEKLRRAAIEWAYIQLGSPPEVLWARSKGERGTVLKIRDYLRWPPEKQKHSRQIWRTLPRPHTPIQPRTAAHALKHVHTCSHAHARTHLDGSKRPHVANARRFCVGTPEELSRTMERVWQVCPASERIVQDIRRFPRALERIVECKGAKVPELDRRHGRRAAAPKRALHSDCDGALAEQELKFARLDPSV